MMKNNAGFTLIEMLVGLAVTGIVAAAILTLYINSNQTYVNQLNVTETQQNLRVGIDVLTRELRLAGYDKTTNADAGFIQAGSNQIQFTMDLDDNGVVTDNEENIIYRQYVAANGIPRIGRDDATDAQAIQPIAEYIEALEFAYAFDADGDGVLDTAGTNRDAHWAIINGANWFELDANDDGLIDASDDTDSNNIVNAVDTGVVADLEDIRAVKIWMLARTPDPVRSGTFAQTFVVGQRVINTNDGFRRRLLTTTVACRNMGL